MPRHRPHPHPPILAIALLALIPAMGRSASAPGPSTDLSRAAAQIPAPRPHFIPVSAAGAELMRAVWEAGGLRDNPHARAVVERMQAEDKSALYQEAAEPAAIAPQPMLTPSLGPDAIANNRALAICTCSGRPISEAEPSIAAWGPYVLASWNDRRSVCFPLGTPSQSHAYSRDYGATFREGSLLWGPGPTDAFHGDPTVAVNRKTGDFYISGILRRGSTFVGVTALRGHFGPDSFVIDTRRVIAIAAGGDFLDKPWMAVDSLTGHVYITWTNFPADFTTQIELQRLDADLNPLGPLQVVRHEPYGYYGVQGSNPTVGPDGILYVPYSVLYADTLAAVWNAPSHFEVVRSDDGGATFGPPHVIANAFYHPVTIPPGSQRGFWAQLLAVDVDRTNGAHRGRMYAVWSESRPLGGMVVGPTSVVEKENNGFFASATPFTPGQMLRGTINNVEKDFYKFTGVRGQIFWCSSDSIQLLSLRVRLICSADTSTLANWHLLYTRAPNAGGGAVFACGLPYNGTYYLLIESPFANTGGYRFGTALVPASLGDRARGIKDEFVCYSDDGTTWSTPARLNDNDGYSDGSEPQVVVDGRGRVHTCWLDWRDDTQCGTSSGDYGASSGDGGVTWGANRRLSDAPSFWGALASCSDNDQGDFMQMAASGDHVYSAFPDSRLGDPDVFVDASTYASTGACPANQLLVSGDDTVLQFSLSNGGNFATPLAWTLSDDRGWLTGASPATSGSAALAANGGTIIISATFHPPGGCSGDSSVVRFVTSDPYIPGHEEECSTVLRCGTIVPALLALVSQKVAGDRVSLLWHSADGAGTRATIERRGASEDWLARGTIAADAGGNFSFEESGVPPGRYTYRIRPDGAALGSSPSEVWVEVPALALALRGTRPNPAGGGPFIVSFTLPSDAPAVLDVLDLAGRRLASRAVGVLGPGPHELRLSEAETLPGGVYVMRLRQSAIEVVSKAVVVR
jgi:hypothetical protein